LILRPALEAPARQIAENFIVNGCVVVDRTRSDYRNYDFDASRFEYLDLAKAEIIDPTKVVCIGLEKGVF